jgi:uncharacterized protein
MTATKQVQKLTGKEWWRDGVKFQCQGSGQCCTSHGEYGFVYLTLEDRQRFAKYFKMTTSEFSRKYCDKTDGIWHLKERKDNPDCIFLDGKRCGTYLARPTQCRTWPFWPEVMNAKTWKKDVVAFCPGVGKGKLIPGAEIEKILLEQSRSNEKL